MGNPEDLEEMDRKELEALMGGRPPAGMDDIYEMYGPGDKPPAGQPGKPPPPREVKVVKEFSDAETQRILDLQKENFEKEMNKEIERQMAESKDIIKDKCGQQNLEGKELRDC